ncbi:MerR family transcriptional regulator [Nocardia sp. NPDC020380]|uniref:MerR family transcriptional regulator n=1 Tax=Nocardia sp. NPDC020380 TaxID=3364309 RepID=UPI0037A5B492
MSAAEMTIGAVAGRFGLATHVLRHWEDVGLLQPRRDSAGRRRFREADVEAVAMILAGRGVGLSLQDLGELFARASDRATRQRLLQGHCARLRERIARAQAALETVEHAMECQAEDFRTCPHFRAKVAETVRLTAESC